MNGHERAQVLERLLGEALDLLRRCHPYVEAHYKRSVYGDSAKKLLTQIEDLIAKIRFKR